MITAIFVAPKARQPQLQVDTVQVVFGCGITGDRHFKKSKRPGQNITFIAAETIENFNQAYGQSTAMGATRRNIITRGIDLNALVGQTFSIGDATFRGVELCEPCIVLARALANKELSRNGVLKAFQTCGGLRADVIGSGIISVGMPLIEVEAKNAEQTD